MYEREHRRSRRDDAFMCDLYDSPRWQALAGPLCNDARNRSLARIVLHMCVDGVEAFSHGRLPSGSTVKPLQYFVGNLAPWLRYKKAYILVHVLIPAHLKGKVAKKYYDWLGCHEISPLRRVGVNGVRVIVHGNTLDTPARRELFNMRVVTVFYPCPHCLHSWDPGLRGQTYCGYRRFSATGLAMA